MSRRINCGEPDPDGEYGCEVMHQVISMDSETIERLTTELELAQLQLHSIPPPPSNEEDRENQGCLVVMAVMAVTFLLGFATAYWLFH